MIKKKVVIIDDEEDLCHLMKTYLKDLNYEVYLAYTLNSGLALLNEVCPDVLFIDNNLPDGLGWEKMNYIRQKHPLCKINLISAYQFASDEAPNDRVSVIEKPLRLTSLKEYL
ncbi:response regulator [Chryseosolibacter indicus]|uniref:Response regulator n=1 Tax=Chryseosolibacter indicus TaxID=2782351 RepID=A0ABS5VLU1_9BACT|nr:response regulator [Chryseosolibacter indicus]MBT1702415.1 response regulator [Chryseosolibacter indicus]